MRNQYKGFTIVELAIVLVVIGIILSMAVKGRQLVRVAQIKADIIKIEKMRTAMNIIYVKRNGGLPDLLPKAPPNEPEFIDKQALVNEGILRPDDMYSHMIDQEWFMMRCGTDGTKPYHYTWDQYKNNNPTRMVLEGNICATLGIDTRPLGAVSTGADASLICYYENALDDDNFSSGDGKHMSHRMNEYKPAPELFENCDTMSDVKQLWMFKLL